MATDTHKYANHIEREARHSALAEFSRDERRPAVLLLSALVLAVVFFAIGLLVGRWTAEPSLQANSDSPGPSAPSSPGPQPASDSSAKAAAAPAPDPARRLTVLVATYDNAEKAQSLIKILQEAGFTEVRATTPGAGETRPRYSVLVGRFTQDEARETARRIRGMSDPRLKNARVIEEQ